MPYIHLRTSSRLILLFLSASFLGGIVWSRTALLQGSPPPTLADDFNDNSLDTAKWDANSLFSGFTDTSLPLTEAGQRLEIGPLLQNTSGSHYRGLRTVNSYSFSDAYSYVELVQAPASNTKADAMFTIGNSVDAYYRLYVSDGTLFGLRKIGTTKTTLFTLSYDAVNHRFLRIRHDANTGNVTLDTAPNNNGASGTWVQRYSEAWHSSISLTGMIFEIKGGTWQTEANAPGKVIFDNFQFGSNSVLSNPPTVTGISPNSGAANGGNYVTIIGTGFSEGATVSLGGSSATNITVVNSSYITAITPAHAAGTVNVTVTNPDAQSATLNNGFTYNAGSSSETILIADDFNDNSLNTAKWDANNLFSGFTDTSLPLTEAGQRLEIGPLPQNTSGSHYRGLRTVNSYSFSDAYSYVELVQAPASNTKADAMFTVGNSVDAYYRLYVSDGTLFGLRKIGATKTTLFTLSYDAVNHRFLRIRRDQNGSVSLDTAPGSNGVPGTWVQRYSEVWSSSISLTGMIFEIKGGTWQTEANAPGKVIFDNFKAAISQGNQTPLANPGGPYAAAQNTSVQLNGSLSSDPEGAIANYQWNFGDGTTGSGQTPAHTYSAAGTYVVTLTVTDNGGLTSSGSTTVTIYAGNQIPIANAGGPYLAPKNTIVQFNGTASSDLDGTISNYQWNFGDGTTGAGATPTHTYSTASTFTATLTVTDNSGASAQSSANVVIAEPDPNTSSIKISPDNLTVNAGTPINFSATAYGSNNVPLAGISYVWQTSYLGQDGLVSISQNGQFLAQTPGSYTVSAQATGHRSQVTVTVVPIPPPCTQDCPEPATEEPEIMWRPGDYPSTRDPQNWRGRPLGATTEGNGNFQLSIPVMSLEGRGSDMDLQLRYNSRVWNKSGSKISFNMDRDWPAPGWTLGFGKLIHMPESGSFLIEPDGTRHSFTGTINRTLSKYTFVGETTDGSFIKYRVTTDRNIHEGYFSSPSATVKYPNGITVYFHSATAVGPNDSFVLYPMEIIDQNGNTISIRYQWGGPVVAQRITTIRDTLGRVLEFHYDPEGLLTAITAAGLKDQNNQTTVSTLVRLHYRYQPIASELFSGSITEESPEGYIPLIDAVYFPSNGQGYWFGDSDSYSPYMMIRKVVMQRNMGFTTVSTDPILKLKEMGTVTPGAMTLQQVYSYPETAQSLSSGPTFETLTETWHGMDTGPAVTTYSVTNGNPRVTTITRPDNTQIVKYGYNYSSLLSTNPLRLLDGIIYQEEIKSGGNVLRRTVMEWENGHANAPRVKSSQTTEFANGQTLTTSKQYSYDDGTYNQVTQVREYGLSNELLRKTNTTYFIKNDLDISAYSRYFENYPRHLYLINSVEVRSATDNPISRIQYGYDETTLENVYGFTNTLHPASFGPDGPLYGVVQHEKDYNPYVAAASDDTLPYRIVIRGNITSITRYTNAATPSGALVDQFRYDITGNVVQSTLPGGRSSKTTFTKDTHNAYPAFSITGSLTDPTAQVISSAVYDLNTGLALKSKNVHGQETILSYYPNSWRAKEIISPAGSRVLFEYDDAGLTGTQTARSSLNGPIISKSVTYLNGLGQETRRKELAVLGTGGSGDVWNTVDTQYDQFGRVTRESRSYGLGQIPKFTETTYDALGRQLVSADARGSALTFVYNDATRPGGASLDAGETVMVRDAWDRWRWSRYNSNGQLAEVIEPNPAGGNGFKTLYTYDVLGNLTRIEQGNQVRRFAYDSIGRLLRQKLAEASATLNSSGAIATTEPEDQRWSSVFTYDDRSNVTTATDARGVKTTLSYSNAGVADPLNRLQSVSYDTSLVAAPLVVPGSPTVTYSYRTKTATELKDINQVAQIQVAGVSSEVFDYDSHGRLHEKRITLSGRPSPMTITYDYDNTSRLNQITYPEQYPGTSRKVVTHNYDIAGRMDNLKVNNVDYASQIAYNTESQITTFKVGTGTNQVTENYTYDAITGLVLNQTVTRGGTTLQSLGYDYHRGLCEDPNAACDGSDWVYWTTGQITRVSNGVTGKLLHFNYDELGRLTNTDQGRWIQTSPKFGIWEYKTDWKQDYTYDRHGNRTSVTASNNSGVTPTPQDGLGSLGYDQNSNRINSAGFTYDAAGNQLQNGTGQSFIYDAAGRLVKVKDANGNTLETYTYNASRRRLITQHGNESSTSRTFYVWSGDSVIAEYTEPSGAAMPKWARNYIYFGTGLLATQEPNGSGGELVRYHHPDQLGTRLITNNADTSYLTQSHMPFGNSLETNSATNRVFTSYERSGASLVDYALNRNYDSRQGRFTQVDPLGMDAVDLLNPQSLNLYSYVANDPVNSTDPSGTFGFGFSINGPGHSFPGVGPGSNGGGLLGGLANFGLGLLSSIFGGGTGSQRHIIGSPFFSLPPSLPILPLPGPVTSTITESFVWNGEQPTAETPKQGTGTAPKDVLRSHAFSFTGFGYVKWAHRHISYRAVEGVIIGIESDITQAIIGYSDQFVGKHTTATSIPYRGHAQINDDKGHIIGAGLGGGVTPFNLFWQSRSVNRGAYERFEREIRKTLTEHRDWSAHIVVQLFYPKITQIIFGNGFRPKGGAYYVVYWKDGKPVYTGWPFKFSN